MPEAHAEREVTSSPDAVWSVLREFGDVSWIPPAGTVEVEGEGPGMVRRIHGSGDGDPVVERLVSASDATRTLVYEIDGNNPLPVTSYRGTVVVEPTGGGARIRWQADYEPEGDEGEAATVIELMLGTLTGWLADAVEGTA